MLLDRGHWQTPVDRDIENATGISVRGGDLLNFTKTRLALELGRSIVPRPMSDLSMTFMIDRPASSLRSASGV